MFKRSGVWYTCIRYKGRKVQRSLGIKVGKKADERLARDIEAKIRTEIVEGSYFEKLVGNNKTFKQLMERFMKQHAPTVSIKMQESYAISLKHLDSFFGSSNLLSISSKMITRYKMLRREEGAAAGSINKELSMLSKAFSLAVSVWEWLKDNPVSRVSREKEDNEIDRWLKRDEETRLIENCPEWLSEIISFALNTGLRQDELLSLEWDRVSLLRKTILIQKTKNGKPKTLPLNKMAIDVLNRRPKIKSIKNDLVFLNRNGKKVHASNLRVAFSTVLRKAGIKKFRWHDLRHTFATRLAQAGVDLYKISKLLGHKDIKMTQRYAHHCPDSLRDGVEALEVDCNLTSVEEKSAPVACSNAC